MCHHHAPSILPFCVSRRRAQAALPSRRHDGQSVPVWDSRDDFGNTNLIVGQAGGRRFARARARPELDRPDAPARRHRRRPHARGTGVPHHLHRPQRRIADPGARASAHVSPLNSGGNRARRHSTWSPVRSCAPGNTGRCGSTRSKALGGCRKRKRPAEAPDSKRSTKRDADREDQPA